MQTGPKSLATGCIWGNAMRSTREPSASRSDAVRRFEGAPLAILSSMESLPLGHGLDFFRPRPPHTPGLRRLWGLPGDAARRARESLPRPLQHILMDHRSRREHFPAHRVHQRQIDCGPQRPSPWRPVVRAHVTRAEFVLSAYCAAISAARTARRSRISPFSDRLLARACLTSDACSCAEVASLS